MWEEAVTGAGIVAITGAMFKVVWNRLGCKQDKPICDKVQDNFLQRLSEGSKKFQKIDKTLDKLQETVHNLDTSTQLLKQSIDKMNGKKEP